MCIIYTLTNNILLMRQENNNKEWTSPEIEKLGNANEIVKNVNVQGAGDSQFSVLDPS